MFPWGSRCWIGDKWRWLRGNDGGTGKQVFCIKLDLFEERWAAGLLACD